MKCTLVASIASRVSFGRGGPDSYDLDSGLEEQGEHEILNAWTAHCLSFSTIQES